MPSIKADRWIKKMAVEHGMIDPFEDRQVRQGVISYGLSSRRRSQELRRAVVRGPDDRRLHHPAEFVRAGAND
jgi:deoxycytidine triphosphate deaminase